MGSYVVCDLPRALVMREIAGLSPLRRGAAWRGDARMPALAALIAALPHKPG